MHIAVLGLGPAGAVLAHRAVARGWTVDGYDPACGTAADGSPTLPAWRSTYGIPVRALPDWAVDIVPFSGQAAELTAHTPGEHRLRYGPYGVVDEPELHRRLSPGIRMHRRRINHPTAAGLTVDAVVDCRGVIDRAGAIRQIAYGLFLPRDRAREAGFTGAEFMDWRPAPDTGSPVTEASFLYVQETGDAVLVEETVLASRTATRVMLPELRRRLRTRLGDLADAATGTETVHFPMDRRRRPWYLGPDADGVATFGAAGGLTHPATGYSVAAAIAAADSALDLIGGESPRSRFAHRCSAALAWRLRLLGAELIVRAQDPRILPRFFDAFFRLPVRLQRGYLEGQDAARVAAAMFSLVAFPGRALPFLRPLPKALYYTLKPR